MAPYLPIETKAYDNHELNCCVQYFLDRKWITNERGKCNNQEYVRILTFWMTVVMLKIHFDVLVIFAGN